MLGDGFFEFTKLVMKAHSSVGFAEKDMQGGWQRRMAAGQLRPFANPTLLSAFLSSGSILSVQDFDFQR